MYNFDEAVDVLAANISNWDDLSFGERGKLINALISAENDDDAKAIASGVSLDLVEAANEFPIGAKVKYEGKYTGVVANAKHYPIQSSLAETYLSVAFPSDEVETADRNIPMVAVQTNKTGIIMKWISKIEIDSDLEDWGGGFKVKKAKDAEPEPEDECPF